MSVLLADPSYYSPKGMEVSIQPKCSLSQNLEDLITIRKHVFTDLKPYVCLFEKCELKLFADRRQWLSHELKDHRREWICYFCSRKPFSSTAQYQQHLAKHHPKSYIANQLPALYDMSQHGAASMSASACPFCKSWETRLREINPQIPLSDDLVVTPSQFFAHVSWSQVDLLSLLLPIYVY